MIRNHHVHGFLERAIALRASPIVFAFTPYRHSFAGNSVVLIVPIAKKFGTSRRQRHISSIVALWATQIPLRSIENGCLPRMAVNAPPPRFISRFRIELVREIFVLLFVPLSGQSWIETLKTGRGGRFISKTIGACYRLRAQATK